MRSRSDIPSIALQLQGSIERLLIPVIRTLEPHILKFGSIGDRLPFHPRRRPLRCRRGCTICLRIVPLSSPWCRVSLPRRRSLSILLCFALSLLHFLRHPGGVGCFGLVLAHMHHELAGGNELTVAGRAIAKFLGDDDGACRAYSVGNVGRVILAVDNEPAEQVPDLDQRVVQHLGHVDARHDNPSSSESRRLRSPHHSRSC